MINNNDFLNDLNDFIKEQEKEVLNINLTGDEDADKGLIDSPAKANYFVKLVQEINKDIEDIENFTKSEIERYVDHMNAFKEERIKSLSGQKYYFESMLRHFTETELAGTKKKSIKLPDGTLQIRKQSPKYTYEDEILLEWIKLNKPNYVKTTTKETVDKALLKKENIVDSNNHMIIDGKIVEGVNIIEQEDKFDVK